MTSQYTVRVLQPNLTGDGGGGAGMIAGNHLDANSSCATFSNRNNRFRAGWVDQADETKKSELALQHLRIDAVARFGALRKGKYPKALFCQQLGPLVPVGMIQFCAHS